MSDNSSIHDHGKNKCEYSSEDEGISASGLYVNQKSILNNFHLQHKFTFGAKQNKEDEKMSEDEDIEGNEEGNGDEGNNNMQGDEDDNNAYSSQEGGRPTQ